MARKKVVICGVDTSKLPVLSYKEMLELFKDIENGDKTARDKFINGNLRLVLSVVQKFYHRGENVDDLFQIGCIGLIKAIDNFDTSHGVRFSTYAVPMIVGEIRRYLRDNNSIRVSRSLKDRAYKALQAKEKLTNKLQREPTIEEISRELGESREDVVLSLEAILEPVSIFEPVYQDNGDAIFLSDQISDAKDKEEKWIKGMAIGEGLKSLKEREKHIINLRFYEGKTQMEVANEIGISQAQISRLEKNALSKLEKFL